jgi:hypothetical protein
VPFKLTTASVVVREGLAPDSQHCGQGSGHPDGDVVVQAI